MIIRLQLCKLFITPIFKHGKLEMCLYLHVYTSYECKYHSSIHVMAIHNSPQLSYFNPNLKLTITKIILIMYIAEPSLS